MDKVLITKVFGFLAFLILMSYMSFELPIGAGIPITGQSLAVLIIGYFCGFSEIILVFLIYFSLGIANLPVFADGATGWATFAGNSGGYLYSFPVAALLVSYFEYNKKRTLTYTFQSFVMATILILTVGVLHLSFSMGLNDAVTYGFKPFWVGGLLKVAMGLLIVYLYMLILKIEA